LDFSIDIDGDKLSGVEAEFDGKALTLAIPEISRYYIRGDLPNLEDLPDMPKLDQQRFMSMLGAIAEEYYKLADEATTVEKGVELTGGKMSVICDKYTIDMTQDFISEFGLAALKEIRKNTNLLDYIEAIMAASYSYEDIYDILDEVEDELREVVDYKVLIRMTVWVQGNEIVARKIEDRVNSDFSLLYKYMVKGKEMFAELDMLFDDTRFRVYGDFTDNGVWSGKPKISITSPYGGTQTFELNVEKLKRSGEFITGTISTEGSLLGASYKFSVELGKNGNQQTIKLSGNIRADGTTYDFGELLLSFSSKKIGEIKFKNRDEKYMVIATDYSDGNKDRASEMLIDFETYRDNAGTYIASIIDYLIIDNVEDIPD
jgi:hypothetical protein